MDFAKLSAGRAPPDDINVVIEIPQGGLVKYEFDHETGALTVDRFLETAMVYPGNYGFIPQTLGGDGDPLDVLVIAPGPVLPGAVIRCRPLAALVMHDENGSDEKIVAEPLSFSSQQPGFSPAMREQIAHFFAHYKDLDAGKWVKIAGWAEADEAGRLILAAIARAAGS